MQATIVYVGDTMYVRIARDRNSTEKVRRLRRRRLATGHCRDCGRKRHLYAQFCDRCQMHVRRLMRQARKRRKGMVH